MPGLGDIIMSTLIRSVQESGKHVIDTHRKVEN